MASDDFKPNCAMVVLDFLIRHSFIEPDTGVFMSAALVLSMSETRSFYLVCYVCFRTILSRVCGRTPSEFRVKLRTEPTVADSSTCVIVVYMCPFVAVRAEDGPCDDALPVTLLHWVLLSVCMWKLQRSTAF